MENTKKLHTIIMCFKIPIEDEKIFIKNCEETRGVKVKSTKLTQIYSEITVEINKVYDNKLFQYMLGRVFKLEFEIERLRNKILE